jgi:hypothetical protein
LACGIHQLINCGIGIATEAQDTEKNILKGKFLKDRKKILISTVNIY